MDKMFVEKKFDMEPTEEQQKILDAMNNLASLVGDEKIEKIQKEVSEFDKKLSAMYHNIESKKYNACQMVEEFKNLRSLLIERRRAKQTFSVVQAIRANNFSTIANPTKREKIENMCKTTWENNGGAA